MKNPLLTFKNFLREQEETDSSSPKSPETEREAKSRIAAGLVKSLFGGIGGLTGGVDSQIKETPEVKQSLPYKGCGINEPFQIEKTPISADTFKILLSYLDGKGAGDYSRSLKELEEGRSVVIGIRNKISINVVKLILLYRFKIKGTFVLPGIVSGSFSVVTKLASRP